MTLNSDIIITIIFYLVCASIGLRLHSKIRNFRDYSIGSYQFSLFTMTATVAATVIGAEYSFGFSEQLFEHGLAVSFIFVGNILHKLVIAYIIAPKAHNVYNMVSFGDIFGHYFGKHARIFSGLVAPAACSLAVAMQVSVFGFMAQEFFGIDHSVGAVFSTIIITTYCFFGGIKGVIYTDVIQILVISIVFPFIAAFALYNYGGLELLITNVQDTPMVNITNHPKLTHFLIMMAVYVLPIIDPAELQRLLIARTSFRIKNSMLISSGVIVLFYIVIIILTAIAYTTDRTILPSSALLYTINNFIPSGISVAAFIAIIAVVMSTMDSYLNAGSVTFVNDVIEPIFGRYNREYRKVQAAKFSTLVISTLACYFALTSEKVMDLVYDYLDLWFPTMVVPLYACFCGIRASSQTLAKSVIAGISAFLIWKFADFEQYTMIMPLVPGITANLIVFYLSRRSEIKSGLLKDRKTQPIQHSST